MKNKPDIVHIYGDREAAETAIRDEGDAWARTKIKPVTVRAFGDTVQVYALAIWYPKEKK